MATHVDCCIAACRHVLANLESPCFYAGLYVYVCSMRLQDVSASAIVTSSILIPCEKLHSISDFGFWKACATLLKVVLLHP